ncbi:MAG TPA: hypothetical protein VIV11_11235 [Kofleriaceae bacterium]
MTLLDRARRDPGLTFVVIAVVATVAIYAATLGRGLVNYDDPWLVADNWLLQRPSWSTLHTIFFDLDSPRRLTLSPEYLPVRDLSIMADFAMWGDWYGGFHLTSLVCYVAAIVVWFYALAAFGIDRTLAGLAMLLWAVHPSHAESVAWIAERKGVLGVMFAGACVLGYAKFRGGASMRWLALAVIAAPLAVWSKAIAAFAIAAIVGLELALPDGRVSWRRSLAGIAAIGIAGVLAYLPVLALATDSGVVGLDSRTPAGRIDTVLGTHGFYLRSAALLERNAVSYPISSLGPSTLDIIVGALGLAVVIAALVRYRRWAPPTALRAAAVVWLFGWLPVSHLILSLQMVFVADRYMLIPTLGSSLAIAGLLLRLPKSRLRALLVSVVVVASAVRALDAQSNWRSSLTLWRRAVESNRNDGSAWSFYAEALWDAGKRDASIEMVMRGLKHNRSPRLLLRKALLVLELGQRSTGVELMRQAALLGEPRAMANVALLLLDDGKLDEALHWSRLVSRGTPSYAAGHRAHGKVALAAKLYEEAVVAFEAAYALEPHKPVNRYNLDLARAELARQR